MKNKFLAIAAATTAVLGAAVVSAPAHAQISPGPNSNINVGVTVPEILYLRTIQSATVNINFADLTSATLTASGSGFINSTPDRTAGTTVDQTSPFTTGVAIPKTISQAYAVWSNTPRAGGINVNVTIGTPFTSGATTLPVAVNATSNVTGQAAPGLGTPFVEDVDLDITPAATTPAGTYNGVVNVRVDAP